MKYSEKKEFIKERWGVSTFKFRRGSWGPTFKFWRGSWGPIFKLWGGSRVRKTWVPGSWSHCYTMPFSGMLSALQFSIFLVSSFIENFLFISFQQKNEIKKGNILIEFKYLLFCSSIDLFDIKDFKRNFKWLKLQISCFQWSCIHVFRISFQLSCCSQSSWLEETR